MKIIQLVVDKIEDEIGDALSYAKLANEHKDDHRSLAEVFISLSNEELRHSTILHNEVVKLITEYRSQHGEPPADMMAVYNYLHGKSIERAEEVKRYQQLYQA